MNLDQFVKRIFGAIVEGAARHFQDVTQQEIRWRSTDGRRAFRWLGYCRPVRPGDWHYSPGFCGEDGPVQARLGDRPHVCYLWEPLTVEERRQEEAPPPKPTRPVPAAPDPIAAALKTLGFPKGERPAPADVRAKYLALMKKHHTDRTGSAKSLERAKRVTDAWTTLFPPNRAAEHYTG